MIGIVLNAYLAVGLWTLRRGAWRLALLVAVLGVVHGALSAAGGLLYVVLGTAIAIYLWTVRSSFA